MIRQAISCDICGTEKKQTNHWFVAYERAGELRVSGWGTRNRSRAGVKHLCGQTCLHKLVDDFMVRNVAAQANVPMNAVSPARGDSSLTSGATEDEFGGSARLIPTPAPVLPLVRPAVPNFPGPQAEQPEEGSDFGSRSWRAGAWKREREREMRALGPEQMTGRRARL